MRIAARPKRIPNAEVGVSVRDTGLSGPAVVDVREKDARLFPAEPRVEVFSDALRGVLIDDVDRAKVEVVRGRVAEVGAVSPLGVAGELGSGTVGGGTGISSPSVHCRCRITDFVAHFRT